MDCSEIRRQLELHVLDGLAPAARAKIDSHLARCPRCREIQSEYGLIVEEIRHTAPAAAPRPALARSVRSAVAAEIRSQRRIARLRRASLAVGTAAALLLLGVAGWALWGPRGAASAPGAMSEVWRHDGAEARSASPADGVVVRGGRMYFLRGSASGAHVAAIDAASGRPRWQSAAPSCGYLAADASRVYCLAPSGPRRIDLIALDARDGRSLWRYTRASSKGLAAPCCAVPLAGQRVCWTTGATAHMIDSATGRTLWTRTITGEGPLAAAADEGGGLHVASAAALRRLDAATGRDAWRRPLGEAEAPWRRPLLAIAGGRALLVRVGLGGAGRLLCLDLATRRCLWGRDVHGPRHLLAAGQGAYLRGADIRAYAGATGRLLWARPAAGCGPLTSDSGLLHFVDSAEGGRLLALEPRTGRTAWEIAGIRSCDAFRRIGRTGYIKTQDGIIHAIALRTP